MEENQKIITFARDIFFRQGIYKTRMDTIAKELRMSKKTLYKHFASKDDLVKAIVTDYQMQIKNLLIEQTAANKSSVEKFIGLFNIVGKMVSKISETALNELRIHYKNVWLQVESFRNELLKEELTKVFLQGQAEGFVNNIPIEILMTVYIASVRAVVNPDFIFNNKFSVKEAFEITLNFLMHGILSNKGKEVLKEFNSEKQQ